MQREFDAKRINAIVNHPDIRSIVAADNQGAIDLSALVADQRNVLLMEDEGGIFFHWLDAGLYQAHSMFLPDVEALEATRAALEWMFTRSDCMEIATKAPTRNEGAAAWASSAGFLFDLESGGDRFYSMRYQDWARSCSGLEDRGRWFDAKLSGPAEDSALHRYGGAAISTILGGQPDKAIFFYNRVAAVAMFPMMKPVSREPLIIGFGPRLFLVADDDIEVLK